MADDPWAMAYNALSNAVDAATEHMTANDIRDCVENALEGVEDPEDPEGDDA